jgi:predicted GNAT superfamily acetyltransferase
VAAGENRPVISVRNLEDQAGFGDAVRLQQEIWGFADVDLLPVRLFVVATKVGGQAMGAYDGGNMAGFLLAIPGIKPDGKEYLHSHMLGVLPEYRNAGVGRLLKLAQRTDAVARGIDLVEWTFDPLETKNAYFNIVRLGAIVRRYLPNQYGNSSSRLHAGLPTDRLVAEWYIRSPRVEAITTGLPHAPEPVEARISIPHIVSELRTSDPRQALEIQRRAAAEFQQCFDSGLAVVGVERSPDHGTYLLGKVSL